MSFWKSLGPEFRDLLIITQLTGVKCLRGYATKGSIPFNPCMKKNAECKDDHPRPRTLEEVKRDFPFYKLIKFSKEICCDMTCPDMDIGRFDCLYKESDKNKRKYQVTWVECPKIQIKPKKICCFKEHIRPPIQRRPPMVKPDTACVIERECEDVSLCPKIKLPHCRPVRNPPKCTASHSLTVCKKIKTPYPAFSECDRPKLRVKRRTECSCTDLAPLCLVIQHMARHKGKSLSPCKKSGRIR